MYAFPSLERGIEWAETVFGITPAYGGEHVGLGTCNTLLSLGECYLEIIAPDPNQRLSGNFGERLAALEEPGLVTWAVEGELTAIGSLLSSAGIKIVGPNRTERQTTSGDLMVWELLFPVSGGYGGRMPFFIDWLDCDNPAKTNPVAGSFKRLAISTGDAQPLRDILSALEVDAEVKEADPAMSVVIESERGEVTLCSTAETSQLSVI